MTAPEKSHWITSTPHPTPAPTSAPCAGSTTRCRRLAKPYFAELIDEYRRRRRSHRPPVLDIGCSYGINAALLKYDATMDDLYERYCDGSVPRRDRPRPRPASSSRSPYPPRRARFTGLDISGPALAYALAAGFLDDAVHADLESADPTDEQRATLAGTDLVISTGCLGYVSEKSIARIVEAFDGRTALDGPLRAAHVPVRPVEETPRRGRATRPSASTGCSSQRRFATDEERTLVLDTLAEVGVDPRGLEADGWLYARLSGLRVPARNRSHPSRPSG